MPTERQTNVYRIKDNKIVSTPAIMVGIASLVGDGFMAHNAFITNEDGKLILNVSYVNSQRKKLFEKRLPVKMRLGRDLPDKVLLDLPSMTIYLYLEGHDSPVFSPRPEELVFTVTPSAHEKRLLLTARMRGQSDHLQTLNLTTGDIVHDTEMPEEVLAFLGELYWINDQRVLSYSRAVHFSMYMIVDPQSGKLVRSFRDKLVKIVSGKAIAVPNTPN